MAKNNKNESDFIEKLSSGINIKSRELYVIGEVDAFMAHKFIASLKLLDKTKGTINIIINSSGGCEASGFAMYDALKMAKNQTIATVYGEASSIAAAILQGAKIRRMTKHSTILIHNGTVPMNRESLQDYVENVARNIKTINNMYHRILSEKDLDKEHDYVNMCNKETLLTAKEALTFYLIDEIIS